MTETKPVYPRWEYTSRTTAPGETLADLLKVMGDLGWEAWHVSRDARGIAVQFKRPKQ